LTAETTSPPCGTRPTTPNGSEDGQSNQPIRTGRKWREGHNQASDCILLRRDLHALYDKGLLHIKAEGRVELHSRVVEHYGQFNGTTVLLRLRA
jgi:hypothetical protein